MTLEHLPLHSPSIHCLDAAQVPLFESLPLSVIGAPATKLQAKMYMPDEYIVREGIIGASMYFIQRGTVRKDPMRENIGVEWSLFARAPYT